MPRVAAGTEVVVTAGAGLTVICTEAALAGSVTEVAVTVAVALADSVVGAA